MTKNILLVFFVLISQGCNFSINKSNEINIYSQRHYDSDKMQYKKFEEKTGITSLLSDMNEMGINLFDIQTQETSLEDIFVKIIKD